MWKTTQTQKSTLYWPTSHVITLELVSQTSIPSQFCSLGYQTRPKRQSWERIAYRLTGDAWEKSHLEILFRITTRSKTKLSWDWTHWPNNNPKDAESSWFFAATHKGHGNMEAIEVRTLEMTFIMCRLKNARTNSNTVIGKFSGHL